MMGLVIEIYIKYPGGELELKPLMSFRQPFLSSGLRVNCVILPGFAWWLL
jgi:hypothetical protein